MVQVNLFGVSFWCFVLATSFIPSFDFHEHILGPWTGTAFADTAWTVLMGTLVAVACGWIGCYLILQGMSLIGDAISHTVLLGIVVAFLVTGQVSGIAMFVGATVTGLLTTVLIELLHRGTRVKEDAAIGIVFTSLFAAGVVLLSTFAANAHIDTQHVLFGDIAFALLEKSTFGSFRVPVAVWQMGVLVLLLAGLIAAFYKELLVVAFDSQLAASLGLRPAVFRYGLMAVLSLTVVGSFTSVGAILVVAMLIAPAATAYLLTDRLPVMFAISAAAGAISSLVGFHAAYWLEVSTGGAMVCAVCGLFGLAFLFSPRHGVVAAAWRRFRVRWRTGEENIIRQVLKLSGGEREKMVPAADVARMLECPPWRMNALLFSLRRRNWVESTANGGAAVRLTPRGFRHAERLDRAHRLWETYLVDKVGLPPDHVHPSAEAVEHVLSDQLVESVDDALGHPDVDPHGARIPRSPVSDKTPDVFALSNLWVGDRGRIVGLADSIAGKPAAESIADLGLTLGQPCRVAGRASNGHSWTVDVGGRTIELEHRLADAVLVRLE